MSKFVIRWVEEECGRIDDGKDPDYVCYRMTGLVKDHDGTWRKIIGEKAIRMSVIIEELTDHYRAKAAQCAKAGPDFTRKFSTPVAVEGWITEKVWQDALRIWN